MSDEILDRDLGPMLTQPDASRFLQIPEGTLEQWRSKGEGPPFIRVGRGVRYPAVWLKRWLLQRAECQGTVPCGEEEDHPLRRNGDVGEVW